MQFDLMPVITQVGLPGAIILLAGLAAWRVIGGTGKFIKESAWPLVVKLVQDWQSFERERSAHEAQMDERLVGVIQSNTQAITDMSGLLKAFGDRMERVEHGLRVVARRQAKHEESADVK